MKILMSACLLGVGCRYDATEKPLPKETIEELKKKFTLIPVCPEQLGGLSTPRNPSERVGEKVISITGEDVTFQYEKGGREALKIAQELDCNIAILKEKSPSCGSGLIYDGNFMKQLILGDGVTTELFKKNQIKVLGESQIEELLAEK